VLPTVSDHRLTPARLAALRVLDSVGPCRYSNVTSYEHGTIYHQTADWLSLQNLVRITDPVGREGRKDSRMVITITAAGRLALGPWAAETGTPGGDEGHGPGGPRASTPG
jgi:hypothetical protein